jgi:hypothetical protein
MSHGKSHQNLPKLRFLVRKYMYHLATLAWTHLCLLIIDRCFTKACMTIRFVTFVWERRQKRIPKPPTENFWLCELVFFAKFEKSILDYIEHGTFDFMLHT